MRTFLLKYWDIIVLGAVIALYSYVWLKTPSRPLYNASERQLVYTSIKDAISVCITASSILFPASLAIAVYILKGELTIEESKKRVVIFHLIIAILFYIISLIIGTFNLFRLPTYIDLKINLAYERWTAVYGFSQAFAFLLAVSRTLRGFLVLRKR